MELKYKDMLAALDAIETERRIPEEVVLDALKEAMCKAYKKDAELSDINIEAEINEKNETIDIYQVYQVVDEVTDDELEIAPEDAVVYNPDVKTGDTVKRKIEITSMSRAAASLARNVIRQKIREAEKVAVYNEYIDQLDDMVIGVVESVKEKFVLVNLGKTVAMMPKSAQIPGERLYEGQQLRVVITEVAKDTKGSQVLVSRATPVLVKRLFEKEVPEVYQGIVEIKAIARDAGDRTKMAVMSHNPEIDPIGSCIGQRGSRVQEIIEELHGEKIDIFLWNDDIAQLVKNALAPAEIVAVFPGLEERSLLVVVDRDELSLAIGRRGKNARLAVKLCNRKIDIKTREDLEEMGLDFNELARRAEEARIAHELEMRRKEAEQREREAREAEERRKAAMAALAEQKAAETAVEEEEELIPEEMQEAVKERIRTEIAMTPDEEAKEEPAAETAAEELPAEAEEASETEEVPAEPEEEPEAAETVKEPVARKRKVDLEAVAQNNDYVSSLEKLAEVTRPKQQAKKNPRKRKSDEEDIRVNNKELEEQIRKEMKTDDLMKPVYTEEELEEIEAQQREEEESMYDFDYDEYEDYYDEDMN